MGVEYKHYLIPSDNKFKPCHETIISLIETWIEHGYIDRSSAAEYQIHPNKCVSFNLTMPHTGTLPNEVCGQLTSPSLIMRWPIEFREKTTLKYPMAFMSEGEREDIYYNMELNFSEDFIHNCSEVIDPLLETRCSCGIELEYDPGDDDIFYAPRIQGICKCGKLFCPQEQVAVLRNGVTGQESEVSGGCVYRFAISIDCGKCFPKNNFDQTIPHLPLLADNDFISLSQNALGIKLYEVSDFY